MSRNTGNGREDYYKRGGEVTGGLTPSAGPASLPESVKDMPFAVIDKAALGSYDPRTGFTPLVHAEVPNPPHVSPESDGEGK